MDELWKIAEEFRLLVCSRMGSFTREEQRSLSGDYLFIIDGEPHFILMVGEFGCWSVVLSCAKGKLLSFEVDPHCPLTVTQDEVENCLSCSARTKITTDSDTLKKLLLGRLKAKVAFLSGKVLFDGDLAAFLKMVSLLKKNGIQPLSNKMG